MYPIKYFILKELIMATSCHHSYFDLKNSALNYTLVVTTFSWSWPAGVLGVGNV